TALNVLVAVSYAHKLARRPRHCPDREQASDSAGRPVHGRLDLSDFLRDLLRVLPEHLLRLAEVALQLRDACADVYAEAAEVCHGSPSRRAGECPALWGYHPAPSNLASMSSSSTSGAFLNIRKSSIPFAFVFFPRLTLNIIAVSCATGACRLLVSSIGESAWNSIHVWNSCSGMIRFRIDTGVAIRS